VTLISTVGAHAEIVVKGAISHREMAMEGPFGEYGGHIIGADEAKPWPKFTVTAMTYRDRARNRRSKDVAIYTWWECVDLPRDPFPALGVLRSHHSELAPPPAGHRKLSRRARGKWS
jgi:3-octaprenyl-4-hydroxybenzoate carboxy-lyase